MSDDADEGRAMQFTVEAAMLDVQEGERVPELRVYAFGSSGRLLGWSDISSEGHAVVQFPLSAGPDQVRALVGPRMDMGDEAKLLADLMRVRAVERMLVQAEPPALVPFPIDRVLWPCWLRMCTVQGTLLKTVDSGGVSIDLPVCEAEVEIYEVEPLWILLSRIPDSILALLSQALVAPGPGPGPDPGPFLSAARTVGTANVASAAVEAAHFSEEPAGGGVRTFRFAGEEQTTVSADEASAALRAAAAQPALVSAAGAGASALRAALVENPDVAWPLLCFLWPPAVTTQLVATVTTDQCGHFRARIWRGCTGENPNLYFKAYRQFFFWRFPIYAPTPIACHTWWNYSCGSEVTLKTTSPFAVTCAPCQPVIAPSHWVLAMAIGNTSLALLRGASSALAATTDSTNIGLTSWDAPWGGDLHVRLEFDYTLRTDLDVKYYRVSWHKVGSPNPFVDLKADQYRHYIYDAGGGTFVIEPYSLGPQVIGGTPHLFEMPPALPPTGQWVIADAVVDTSSATFDVSLAPPAEAGLYEFKLELFDGSGARVNANSLGISYRVPSTTDLTTTIVTDDANALGLVTTDGALVFQLHIDNNMCSGSIGAATLGSQTADSECGVLDYSPPPAGTLSLPFTASHPNGFATYYFRVLRGLVDAIPAVSGPVGTPPGSHILTPTVSALLGPCTTAGFAEDLYVYATATDGWSYRLEQYDAHPAPRPFVLTPGS